MSADIKELRELIEQEKAAEEKVRKAKEAAENVLKAARERAESTVQGIDSDPYWERLRQARKEETARKKAQMEEEYKKKTTLLEKTAQRNFEKAVTYVVEKTMRVEI